MGNFSNFGATLLDVQQGMEYQKGIQRKDADWTRGQKRADMQDQVAQYGLEDLQQTRGDKAARRSAAAGATDIESAAKAEKAAALARGDTAGATAANESRLRALVTDFQTTAALFEQKQQPIKQGLEATALAGQVARQPATEAIAGQNVADQSMAAREKLLARFYQIAQVDVNAAKQLLSDSPILFPGKKVADIMVSKDGQRVAVVGEDGQPLTMLNKPFMEQLAQKYGDPGKVYEVEPGKALVHVNSTGTKTKEVYKAADAPTKPADKFLPVNEGTTGFFDPKTRTVVPVGTGGADPKRVASNQKFADDMLVKALGGASMVGLGGANRQRYIEASGLREKYVASGMPPAEAIGKALDEVTRAQKSAPQGGAAPVDLRSIRNLYTQQAPIPGHDPGSVGLDSVLTQDTQFSPDKNGVIAP